ncbi:MAG: DNA-3-methyladenine glycosylase 2 family protein [Rhodoblastus sp.]|nr:MAG: DNA-3-methyladenine glycosylase 2 family protein [Rhodoblastus sp.]
MQGSPPRKASRKHAPAPRARDAPPPGRPIDREEDLDHALAALEALDPVRIAPMRARAGRPPLRRRAPGFEGLCAIVVSQQVSVASARHRGEASRPLRAARPAAIAAASDEALRACGLSAPKLRTLRACAEAILSGRLDLDALAQADAERAHAALTAVKGIGPWTADIYLLFCLGHPDAFPAGDLALQEAARLAFGLRTRPDPRRLEALARVWRPWRAVAARLLWSYYAVAKTREWASPGTRPQARRRRRERVEARHGSG